MKEIRGVRGRAHRSVKQIELPTFPYCRWGFEVAWDPDDETKRTMSAYCSDSSNYIYDLPVNWDLL